MDVGLAGFDIERATQFINELCGLGGMQSMGWSWSSRILTKGA